MVSWGPLRKDGERFYTGQKNAPPWVRDLNWKHRCRLEAEGREIKNKRKKEERMRRAMGITEPSRQDTKGKYGNTKKGGSKSGIKMKMGAMGAMVPDESDEAMLERLAFAVETRKNAIANSGRTARSGRSTARTLSTARTDTARSTARSRSSISTIGTINTEMREIIRETASKEIEELKKALQLEATLRAESDKKIEQLVGELEKMRNNKK